MAGFLGLKALGAVLIDMELQRVTGTRAAMPTTGQNSRDHNDRKPFLDHAAANKQQQQQQELQRRKRKGTWQLNCDIQA